MSNKPTLIKPKSKKHYREVKVEICQYCDHCAVIEKDGYMVCDFCGAVAYSMQPTDVGRQRAVKPKPHIVEPQVKYEDIYGDEHGFWNFIKEYFPYVVVSLMITVAIGFNLLGKT